VCGAVRGVMEPRELLKAPGRWAIFMHTKSTDGGSVSFAI
jgi:hypothetical protein